jgi:hypothetical protein
MRYDIICGVNCYNAGVVTSDRRIAPWSQSYDHELRQRCKILHTR